MSYIRETGGRSRIRDGAAIFLLDADFVSFDVISLENLFDAPQVEKPPKALPGLGELV